VSPPPRAGARFAGPLTRDAIEYGLRVVFFALVPFGVVLLAKLVPMAAAITNMILTLAAFFSGELLRGASERRPWLKKILRRQLAFEAHYRAHAPRPFLYYVFYPLLFPYWLFVRDARRELLLFKGHTLVTLLLVTAIGAWRYVVVYQPELGFRPFAVAFGIGVVIESVAVMAFVMPVTTSVVALHQNKQRGRLVALLAVGLVSAGGASAYLVKRHRTLPSLETRQRVIGRTAANRPASKAALARALEAAWTVRRTASRDAWEREDDGTVLGAPLDAARDVLEGFYRTDEAAAFELWTTARKQRPALMLVFAEGRRKGYPVWLGMRSDGTLVEKLRDVPKTARAAMRTAGEL